MRTCKFCRKDAHEDDIVKYEARHYAHFKCYLNAAKHLDYLHAWQAGGFPARLMIARLLIKRGLSQGF